MANIILILIIIMETTIGVFRIRRRDNLLKIVSLTRISSFIIFIILTLANIIIWSFRWYLLFTVLFVLAISSTISLLKNKNKEYKTSRVVVKYLLTILILMISTIPALIFPQYQQLEPTGDYGVLTSKYTYVDFDRLETFSDIDEYRKVTVEYWYPESTNEVFPLVIFSHGAFGISASNTSTYKELASNGYVVASISHPYQSMYTRDVDGNITTVSPEFIQEVTDVNNGLYDNETSYKLTHKWLDLRTDDINFVLDTIISKTNEANTDEIYNLIDTEKIGLMGHSLGGAASAKLGKDRVDIDTVVNLDGAMIGEEIDFNNGEFIINQDIYPIPILFIFTDDLISLIENTSEDTVIPSTYILETNKDAHKVYFKGTNHMSVTDLPHFSPFLSNMLTDSIDKSNSVDQSNKDYVVETMNNIILEFLDWSLKGEGNFDKDGTY